MKKVLLSFALAAFAFGAKAQCGTVGFATDANGNYTGFYQDFTSSSDFYVDSNKSGIFPWGDTVATDANNFYAPFTKTGGVLSYTISQPYGKYEPVGISFGTDSSVTPAVPHVLDLSADASFEVKFSIGGTSDSTIKFRLALQDVNGNLIDTKAGANPSALYDAVIEYKPYVKDGASDIVFKGTFSGGGQTIYDHENDPAVLGPDECDASNPATLDNTSFDWTAVSGLLITVVRNESSGSNCYYPGALNAFPVTIDYIKVGDCPIAGITKANNVLRNLNIVPNPATSIATVNYETVASNVVVKVSDLAGAVVKTVNGSSTSASFNVSDLAHGLYIVTVEVDGSPVSMKKLMVK